MAELPNEVESSSASDRSSGQRAAFSADGMRLAVTGARLTLYDGLTGAILRRVDAGPWKRVRCVELRDDGGATLVVDTQDATVIRRMTVDLDVWDDVPIDRPATLTENATFTDRGHIMTGLSTRTLRLLEQPPLILPHSNLGFRFGNVRVVASGDGSRIATLARPVKTVPMPTEDERRKAVTSVLQVWEGGTLRLISRTEQFPEGCIATSVAYGPTADFLALGCLAWDDHPAPVLLATLTPGGAYKFERLGGHSNPVKALAFNAQGSRLFTGSVSVDGVGPSELKCWDTNQRSGPLWERPYPATITVIAVSPDGTRIVVGGEDGLIRLFPSDRPNELLAEVPVGGTVTAIAFAHAKPLLAVRDTTDRAQLFEISDKSVVPIEYFDEPGAGNSMLAFNQSDDSLYVLVAGGVGRLDVQAMKSLGPYLTFAEPPMSFALIDRPEAVVAVTSSGKLIQRLVPGSSSHH